MKITKSYLKQIIKEELQKIEEGVPPEADLEKLVDAEVKASGLSRDAARSVVLARLNIQDMSKAGKPSNQGVEAVIPQDQAVRTRVKGTLPSAFKNSIT